VTAVRAIEGGSWVVDGNYQSKIGTLVWDRAEVVIWVNPSRPVAMWLSVRRTVRRVVTRQDLWNGNRERWSALAFWRKEESLLWFAWTTYHRTRDRYAAAMADPANASRRIHRVRNQKQVGWVLEALAA